MCTWEECVFWFFRCNVLNMLIKSNFSIVSFRFALLVFCLEDLSINASRVLKSPTMIVFPSISPFMSVSICCRLSGCSYIRGIYIDDCNILFLNGSFKYSMVSFFVFLDGLDFKVSFVWYEYCNACFPVLSVGMKSLFPPLTFNLEVSFAPRWVYGRQQIEGFCFFIPICHSVSFDWSIQPIDISGDYW